MNIKSMMSFIKKNEPITEDIKSLKYEQNSMVEGYLELERILERKEYPNEIKLKHECVKRSSGQTNHIERFNNTLRQRLSRYVRKTLSFWKKEYWHDLVTKLFIIQYNLSLEYS